MDEEDVYKSSLDDETDVTLFVEVVSIFLAFDDEIAFRILYPIPDIPEICLTIGFVGAKVFPSFNFELRLVR